MFGSLLASYVVGFISILAAKSLGSNSHGLWGIVLPAVQYTSISLTFAYSTASFYLSYHAGILTMHHMPLARLRFDFLLALAQALSFGFSMLVPEAFPFFVGLLLIAGIYRQGKEHKRLAESFFKRFHPSSDSDDDRESDTQSAERKELSEKFRAKFIKVLQRKEYEELSGWKPGSPLLRIFAALFLIVGAVSVYFIDMPWLPNDLWLPENWHLFGHWRLKEGAIALESVIVLILVFIRANRILRDRATFLYSRKRRASEAEKPSDAKMESVKGERPRMDERFDEFLEALKKSD